MNRRGKRYELKIHKVYTHVFERYMYTVDECNMIEMEFEIVYTHIPSHAMYTSLSAFSYITCSCMSRLIWERHGYLWGTISVAITGGG